MRPLRIAFLVNRFPVVTETFIVGQVTGLLALGHRVDVVSREASDPGTTHTAQGCTVVSARVPTTRGRRVATAILLLPRVALRHPIALLRIARLHVRDRKTPAIDALFFLRAIDRLPTRPDVVHAQFGPLGAVAAVLRDAGVLDAPLVTSFRGYDLSWSLRRHGRDVYRHLLARGDLFLASCDYFRRRLVAELDADPERIVVHRSGIDVDRFTPAAGDDAEPTRILTIGRLVEKKGVAYAIRAIAAVATDCPDVDYAILGDGPLRAELEALVASLGLADRVRFLGERTHDEIRAHVGRSALLVAPSVTAASGDEEGIPNTLKEAMAAERPVVATRHAGIPELVDDGVSGFLVPERDVDALADRIRALLDDPTRRAAMGRAGRRTVRRDYDRDVLNRELVELYTRSLDARTAGA